MGKFSVPLQFKPVAIIASQSDIQCQNIFHVIIMDGVIPYRRSGSRKTVQKGFCAFSGGAFEVFSRRAAKVVLQIVQGFCHTRSGHFQHQVVLITVTVCQQTLR